MRGTSRQWAVLAGILAMTLLLGAWQTSDEMSDVDMWTSMLDTHKKNAVFVSDQNGIPTLGVSLRGMRAQGTPKALLTSLHDMVKRLAKDVTLANSLRDEKPEKGARPAMILGGRGKKRGINKTRPHQQLRGRHYSSAFSGAGWEVAGTPAISHDAALGVWRSFAEEFRKEHPDMSPLREQREMNAAWKLAHPEIYFVDPNSDTTEGTGAPGAQGGFKGSRGDGAGGDDVPAYDPAGKVPVYAHLPEGEVPPTVLEPEDDGVRDFDGRTAVMASLPRLGDAPSRLTEWGKEAKGSFAARVFDASGQPEILVERVASTMDTPFTCTYRAYRRLAGEFTGNIVYTGFKRRWHSYRGKITTGMNIPPSGQVNEFDVMTCRDDVTGEVQYFKLSPETVLARMKQRHCESEHWKGPFDISCI